MNTFVLEIWDDEGSGATFYTVRKSNSKTAETDSFISKYKDHPKYGSYLTELLTLLYDIIAEEGAKIHFFKRPEGTSTALPPRGKLYEFKLNFKDFPLRLYCLRLSDGLVVLFNGGHKTTGLAHDSKAVSMKLNEANTFAKAINNAIDDTIRIEGRRIISNEELSIIELDYL